MRCQSEEWRHYAAKLALAGATQRAVGTRSRGHLKERGRGRRLLFILSVPTVSQLGLADVDIMV